MEDDAGSAYLGVDTFQAKDHWRNGINDQMVQRAPVSGAHGIRDIQLGKTAVYWKQRT
jgi:hypothetical protein